MRILFISHYFYPEGNAPATRVFEMTRRWIRAGHKVTVITAAPNVPSGIVYEGYENNWHRVENVEGVRVVRVWTYLAEHAGARRRIASYLSFMFTAVNAALREERPDIVIATSPQFFSGWAGRWTCKLRGLPFILEIRDIWPASIVAVGAMKESPLSGSSTGSKEGCTQGRDRSSRWATDTKRNLSNAASSQNGFPSSPTESTSTFSVHENRLTTSDTNLDWTAGLSAHTSELSAWPRD